MNRKINGIRLNMQQHIKDAQKILEDLGMPRAQINKRSALCLLALLDLTPSKKWDEIHSHFIGDKYAKERVQQLIPLKLGRNRRLHIRPGAHGELIRSIVEDFGPRFVPGGEVLYLSTTGHKKSLCEESKLAKLGLTIESHEKMPDVVVYYPEKQWLVLIESVTSHGPMDGKRHAELALLFAKATIGLVYVTAFPNRAIMSRYIAMIAWETEVWVADAPSHLIHFNGSRFLGPY